MAYKTPDVYVKEISLFPPSVAEVETAIPAFIGYTEKAKLNKDGDLELQPTRISSLAEYELYFGGAKNETFTVNLVNTGDNNSSATVLPVDPPSDHKYKMYYNMQMFFANGGGPCYVVSVGDYSDSISKGSAGSNPTGLLGGLLVLEKEDEPTMIIFPDATELSAANHKDVMNAALAQCSKLMDRVAIIDVHDQNPETFRNNISANLDEVKYGAAYHPFLETTLNYAYSETDVTVASHVDSDGTDVTDGYKDKKLFAKDSEDHIKALNNQLYNVIKAEIAKATVTVAPSSTVAGVYAKVDNSRGCWKAPANVSLASVKKPAIKITNDDQELLNVDVTAGKSINAIRSFTGKGTMIWGARTLAGNDNEWRYISVRRFFNMVEESVKKSTYWAVFESNDANTWIKVKAMIENYLIQKWRDGALQGAKPEQAFFVKVGLGQTMTAQDILEGRMNVEIGMAVVRPAEFIILKFSHKMPEA